MSLSDRNSRLLLVISLYGVLFFLSKRAFNIIFQSYSELYVDSGIGVDHLFANALLVDVFYLFGIALIYCIFEAQTYANNPIGRQNYLVNKADDLYKFLLNSLVVSLLLSFILFFLIIFLPTIKTFFFGLGLIIVLFLMFRVIVELLKSKYSRVGSLRNKLNYLLKTFSFSIFLWIICYFSMFIFTGLFGIMNNYRTQMNISFNGASIKSSELIISYKDAVPDRAPEKFIINISNQKIKIVSLEMKREDMLKSFVEIQEHKKSKFLFFSSQEIKKNYLQSATYKLDGILKLSDYLMDEGINTIEILFSIESGLSDDVYKDYRVVNQIKVEHGIYSMSQDEFSLKL